MFAIYLLKAGLSQIYLISTVEITSSTTQTTITTTANPTTTQTQTSTSPDIMTSPTISLENTPDTMTTVAMTSRPDVEEGGTRLGDEDDDDDGLERSAVLGIAFGSLGVLVIAALIVIIVCCRR